MNKKQIYVKKDFSFAQVPHAMIGTVSRGAFMLYAAIHFYCENWRENNPSTLVTQKDLKAKMNCSKRSISEWTQELHKKGWASVKQTGLNQPNQITLHGVPKRR